jgi:hypothetical protein
VLPVTLLALRRAGRSPAGFAAAIAAVFLVFFSLNKFAFCNYYYFVISILCASVAATGRQAAVIQPEIESPTEPQRLAA